MGLSLDIGCGAHKHHGALGVDRQILPGVAVVCDFDQGLPFREGSATSLSAQYRRAHGRSPRVYGRVLSHL